MAKEMRMVIASEDVATLIDKGAKVDADIKTLTSEDKGIKTKLTSLVDDELGDDTSVRFKGKEAAAVVTAVESMSLDLGAEGFPALNESMKAGFLSDVVETKKELVVPPDSIDKAAEALEEAGLQVTVAKKLSVKADDVRKMRKSEVASVEEAQARKNLEACLNIAVTHRVKYER